MQANQAHAVATVRALKGPPLTIFVIMAIVGQALTQRRLSALTGHTPKTTRAAIDLLCELGFATRDHYRAWQLTPNAQLILPGFPLRLPEVGENPTSAPTTTTYLPAPDVKMIDVCSEESVVVVVPEEGRDSHFSQTRALLRSAGIGEPTRSRLLTLPHITPEYVAAHIRFARKEHTDTALLIFRMQQNDPLPNVAPQANRNKICPICGTGTMYQMNVCPTCGICTACHPRKPCP